MKFAKSVTAIALATLSFTAVAAPTQVNMKNFVNAETDSYFTKQQKEYAVNTFKHTRNAITPETQVIIRSNIDLLYSTAVVDVSEGATFSLPADDTYQVMQLIDEDHKIPAVLYPGDTVHLEKKDLSSGSHIYILMRTATTAGIKHANDMQDAAVIDARSAKPYVSKNYDQASLEAIKAAFLADVASTKPEQAFGPKDNDETPVTPYQYRLGAAVGWAGMDITDAFYIPVSGTGNQECSSMTFEKPPLNYENGGYWSITVYDKRGWLQGVDQATADSASAVPNKDGSYTVHYNCPGELNNIDVKESWGFVARFYRPTSASEIKAYKTTFPKPKNK